MATNTKIKLNFYSERLKKLQNILKIPLLVSTPSNIKYLCGFDSSNAYLIITKTAFYLITDTRYAEAAKPLCKSLKLNLVVLNQGLAQEFNQILASAKIKNLEFEPNHLTFNYYNFLKTNLKLKNFTPSTSPIESLRQSKDNSEIKLMKKAQAITDQTFKILKSKLKAGQTELQIAFLIEQIGRELGADDISFEPIVAFGKHSSIPHHKNTSQKLRKGDLILLDFGFKYQNYCSDMSRTIFTKTPNKLQAESFLTTLKAQEESIKLLKQLAPNKIEGNLLDECARTVIDSTKFKNTFTHALGHGIGIDVHESPAVSKRLNSKIPDQSVITIEPGIYLEGKHGIRIEDMLYINGKSIENLTSSPKSLESSIIKL